jgi:hypothetical protein
MTGTCDYLLMDPDGPAQRNSAAPTVARRRPSGHGAREFVGANRVGAIVGAIGGAIGLCLGAGAVVIAVIPPARCG